ncbi:carbohydrate-binding module family 50 protein [Suillus luteus UH-Slu-Lm8-n1]|uniref:Carbohydrate-binding module family 50 protein n=1 Tax=Suillus luteus UH-Slu-Lm8-n1 TaxID=930992 RepID=A0A0D0AK08_9AGAM|nr:carbohydrate-binding module family 50 protein [Suillus luteus UH-Slu-Lm8-n1]
MHASFFTARLVALAAIASVVSGQSVLPARCDRNVTVRAGDTCDAISAANSVSTYQLATVNSGVIDSACDNLYIGEIICLGISGQDCNVTHVLQTGDTCFSVATAAGIPLNTLLANNPNVNSNCTNVYPGEVLCTASQIYVN